MRDRLQDMGSLDRVAAMSIITDEISRNFVRRPMAEFEYLRDEIEPPMFAIVLAFLIAIPGSLALSRYFHKHEMDFLKPR